LAAFWYVAGSLPIFVTPERPQFYQFLGLYYHISFLAFQFQLSGIPAGRSLDLSYASVYFPKKSCLFFSVARLRYILSRRVGMTMEATVP